MSNEMTLEKQQDGWGSKMGLILAMAGNAVGLGNFWKFPYMAAGNGGGAFMIPYFIALLLLGLPIMIMEWQFGRRGGENGENTIGPMIYLYARSGMKPKNALTLGAITGGLCFAITLLINSYYTHIVGWTLNYSMISFTGDYMKIGTDTTSLFVNNISDPVRVFVFWIIVLIVLAFAVSKGISGGVEKWAKFMMPTLYIFAFILLIMALTTKTPVNPDWSALKGLDFVWNPDFSKLSWSSTMAGAGQVFFSLSIGMGLICHYASYLKKEDDIVVSSVATISLNEFAEVILAATIVIPLGYAYLGGDALENSGPALTFITLPSAFAQMGQPLGNIVGGLWFLLLFFAGFTSSMALYSYVSTFISETINITKKKAAWFIVIAYIFIGLPIAIETIINKSGATYYLDEIDLWIGQYFLLVLGLIEVIIYTRCVSVEHQLEINQGALWKVPRWFITVLLRYITPIFLILVLVFATWERYKSGAFVIISDKQPYGTLWINLARIMMILMFVFGYAITRKYIKNKYSSDLQRNLKMSV